MKVAACLLAFLSFVLAEPGDLPPEFKHARDLHYQAVDGNKQGYEQADKLFTELYRQYGRDARIRVYYGSLRLLEASHTWALWKKNELSKEGIQLMDSAVHDASGDLEVRFVRAATTYDLPGFFHRKAQSERDFDFLAERAEAAVRYRRTRTVPGRSKSLLSRGVPAGFRKGGCSHSFLEAGNCDRAP